MEFVQPAEQTALWEDSSSPPAPVQEGTEKMELGSLWWEKERQQIEARKVCNGHKAELFHQEDSQALEHLHLDRHSRLHRALRDLV